MNGWHWIWVDLHERWVDEWVDELVEWPARYDEWLRRPRGTGPPQGEATSGGDPFLPRG